MDTIRFAKPPVEAEKRPGTFGEMWEAEPAGNVWRCGDHLLGVDERDWARWMLVCLGEPLAPPGNAVVVAGGATPPWGFEAELLADLDTHPYVIENELNVPRVGLDAFLGYARDMRERAETAGRPRVGRSFAELALETSTEIAWLVPGLLAPGWTTKVAAREKTGKGTHCFYLIGKLERGEPSVYGPSRRTTTLVVTEEPAKSVREKAEARSHDAAQRRMSESAEGERVRGLLHRWTDRRRASDGGRSGCLIPGGATLFGDHRSVTCSPVPAFNQCERGGGSVV